MIELFLDTTVAKTTLVKIKKDGKLLVSSEGGDPLTTIKQTLKKGGLSLKDIGQFTSNPGPGSYTGVRIGAAIANALNFALDKKEKLIEPVYE